MAERQNDTEELEDRRTYVSPETEVIRYQESDDVIMTSPEGGGNTT